MGSNLETELKFVLRKAFSINHRGLQGKIKLTDEMIIKGRPIIVIVRRLLLSRNK